MMTKNARLLTVAAGLLLLVLYVVPLWRISLVAPQYPEGLGMLIHVNTVRGVSPNDLTNINGLNHYIGMKHIEPDSIPVLRIIPWVVAALILGAVIAGAVGRRALLWTWLGAFAVAGIVGMITFWWWEYDYGHHLDVAQAIIKVPGMSYQPPLLGSRQILNFTARSYPALGSWFIGVSFALGVLGLVAGCTPGVRPIAYGRDACAFCRMLISDSRYGAEIVTKKGRVVTFDAIECLAAWYETRDTAEREEISSIWVADYSRPNTLVPVEDARFYRGSGPGSPMGRGMLAIAANADASQLAGATAAGPMSWPDVLALEAREHWSTSAPSPVAREPEHAVP